MTMATMAGFSERFVPEIMASIATGGAGKASDALSGAIRGGGGGGQVATVLAIIVQPPRK